MSTPDTSIDSRIFNAAFPFFLQLDADFSIISWGRSLLRLVPNIASGQSFDEVFRVYRPSHCNTAKDVSASSTRMVVLECKDRDAPRLRCQWFARDDDHLVLMSPIITRLDEMNRSGLGMGDFALTDSTGDMLLIHRTSQMSLEDATRLAQRLRSKSDQLSTISGLSTSGIVYFSADKKLNYVNPAFLEMFECKEVALIGESLRDFKRRLLDRLDTTRPQPAEVDDSEDIVDGRYTISTPSLLVFETRKRATPGGGLVVYIRNATIESEVDRMKSEFLTTAAHELRTPMASILGFSELLLNREFEAEQRRELLETIHKQSRRMTQLLNDLLDVARIEARQASEFRIAPVNIDPILRAAIESTHYRADHHRLVLNIADGLPLIAADADRLQQALLNVLSNAIKYSPNGGCIAICAAYVNDAEKPGISLSISDQGLGMSAADLTRVFDRFFRADKSCHIPGTGLGLSLVKQIIELHGGTIKLDSVEGLGTTVHIWLPTTAQQTEPVDQDVNEAVSTVPTHT